MSRGESRVIALPSNGDDLKIKHIFICLPSGLSLSAKTSFCICFLQNLKELCTVTDFSSGIVWCYSELCAIPYQKLAGKKHVRFHEGFPADFSNSGEKPCLIFLDDLFNDAYSKDICDLFTKGSHHRNISVILITQNVLSRQVLSRYLTERKVYCFEKRA